MEMIKCLEVFPIQADTYLLVACLAGLQGALIIHDWRAVEKGGWKILVQANGGVQNCRGRGGGQNFSAKFECTAFDWGRLNDRSLTRTFIQIHKNEQQHFQIYIKKYAFKTLYHEYIVTCQAHPVLVK